MKRIFITLLAGAALTSASCKKDDKKIEQGEPEKKTLTMLGVQDFSATLPITVTGNWTVEIPAGVDWLDVDKRSGSGDATLTLKTIKANTGAKKQTTIKIISAGKIIEVLISLDAFYSNPVTTMMGGNKYDDAGKVIATSDGGYLFVGSTSSNTGFFNENPGPGAKAIAIKYNAEGTIQWKKYYGGNRNDEFVAAAATPDGGYVLLGETSSNQGDFSTNHGNTDLWVQKIDKDGNAGWMKLFGSHDSEAAGDIAVAPDGSIYLSGLSSGTDGDMQSNHGSGDIFIARLQADGTTVFAECYGGQEYESGRGKLIASATGVVFAAFTNSSDGDLLNAGGVGNQDGWLCKLNWLGRVIWSKKYGGAETDYFVGLTATPDGGFIVTGSTEGPDFYGEAVSGQDAFAMKVNEEGVKQWFTLVDDEGATESFNNITLYKNTSYILTGTVLDARGLDGWLCLIDGTGKKLWTKAYGGDNVDYFSSITCTTDNTIVATGASMSSNGDIPSNAGDFDIFIHKFK
ncbi:MAG: BACON domain-containing protein [Pseudobacter sp.]|uniref:BACON domain-containing protein n=1 Tax=Pseudobacter sp. TaxID=2045420 RepID=UPI003F82307C